MISSQKNCQPLITQTSRSITKIVLKRKETELKEEIIHKVIIDNFYQRKLISPTQNLFKIKLYIQTAQKILVFYAHCCLVLEKSGCLLLLTSVFLTVNQAKSTRRETWKRNFVFTEYIEPCN